MRPGRTDLIAAVLVGLATAVIVWLRTPYAARETLWAEDGRNFLSGAAANPSPVEWFAPYMGYLHFVPRVSADLIAHFVPIAHWAPATTAAASLVIGAVSACVVVLSRDVMPTLIPRIGLGLVAGLIACGPFEVAGNLANLHTYFMWLTPWLLLYRPRTRVGAVLVGVVAGIGSFTEIQVAAFVPLFLWKFTDGRRWPARVGIILGLIGQFSATVFSPRTSGTGGFSGPADVLLGYVVNAVGGVWWSHPLTVDHYALVLPTVLVIACLPPAIAIAYGLWRGTALQRVAMLALTGGSATVWTVGYEANSPNDFPYASFPHSTWMIIGFLRYATGAALLLAATMPLAFSVLIDRTRASTRVRMAAPIRALIAVVPTLALLLALGHAFVPADGVRTLGPFWAAQAQSMETRCAPSAGLPASQISRGAIAPGHGWHVALSCGFVRTHR